MSTKASAALLAQAAKDLSHNWEQTKSSWQDVKSAEFEAKYLDVLPPQVTQAMTVMAEIDVLLRKIRSDCE
jgi:hypothetical protein